MNLTAVAQTRDRNPRGDRTPQAGAIKHRALARLYERRAAVDQLIDALERYQQDPGRRPEQAQFEGFSGAGTLSSDYAQSRT